MMQFLGNCTNSLMQACTSSNWCCNEEDMKKKPDLMIMLVVALGAGLLISSVAQSGLL